MRRGKFLALRVSRYMIWIKVNFFCVLFVLRKIIILIKKFFFLIFKNAKILKFFTRIICQNFLDDFFWACWKYNSFKFFNKITCQNIQEFFFQIVQWCNDLSFFIWISIKISKSFLKVQQLHNHYSDIYINFWAKNFLLNLAKG